MVRCEPAPSAIVDSYPDATSRVLRCINTEYDYDSVFITDESWVGDFICLFDDEKDEKLKGICVKLEMIVTLKTPISHIVKHLVSRDK